MGRTIRSLLAAVLVCCAAARADVAFSATAGSFTEVGDGWDGFNHDYSATIWHVFDQMVLFGATAGMQIDGGNHQFPLHTFRQKRKYLQLRPERIPADLSTARLG